MLANTGIVICKIPETNDLKHALGIALNKIIRKFH